MGTDIHMSVEVRQVSGHNRPDAEVQRLRRAASEGDHLAEEALKEIEVREGPWEVVAIETHRDYYAEFEEGQPRPILLPKEPGWRAEFFPWGGAKGGSAGDWVATRLNEVPGWWEDQDYEAFARLAGVRNYEDVTPIAEPRGLPEDYAPPVAICVDGYNQFGVGDHSHSWLLVSEILAYDWGAPIKRSGSVGLKEYLEWKESGKADPSSWCSWTSATTIEESEVAKWADRQELVYVRCEWETERDWPVVTMAQAWADRFGADAVRFTFGFDS